MSSQPWSAFNTAKTQKKNSKQFRFYGLRFGFSLYRRLLQSSIGQFRRLHAETAVSRKHEWSHLHYQEQEQHVLESKKINLSFEQYVQTWTDYKQLWKISWYVTNYSQKEDLERFSDLQTILKESNYYLSLIGETAQNPDSIEEVLPKVEASFMDVDCAVISN
jgi:hypothetical protein